ncbi:MAG: response regulator [Deltaproteobacteria bacterium]|nr:response regulator [Deltaproteobacteria bacterium]
MNGLLFIDDEEGMRRSVVRALQRESYPIFTAENGESGVQFVQDHILNIGTVISDFKMPGMDGLEALTSIGKLNPDITRIILTGYATVETAIQATNEGIDGFLTKPFDNRELRAKIHEITIRKCLRQFVSDPVYREITDSAEALRPRFHEVTVLFSDIRNFTKMSRDSEARDIAAFLNHHYFTPMAEIIHQHNGTVDKHIGDSIMAVFGAPVLHADDAVQAIHAAVGIQKRAVEINASLDTGCCFRLNIGIGISTGKVFSGILGSIRKKEFTSIGMAVNMASRLQRLARAGEILICSSTRDKVFAAIRSFGRTEALPPVTVKGIEGPITVYKVDQP